MGAGGIRAGAAFVEVSLRDVELQKGLKRAQANLRRFGSSVTALGQRLAGVGVTLAAPFVVSAKIFADFSDQMSTVGAVTNATAADMARLTAEAKRLGGSTSFMAKQVAEGMTALGRAGFKPDEILQAIPAVLDLARATGTELGDAAEISAAALRGFNLEAEQTGEIADVLTATVNNSAQTLTDIGEALKFVAPLASEAGASINDTAASLGILANNGIRGTMAGTALARAYKNLSTAGTAKMLHAISVSATDANRNLRPLSSILADIGRATKNLGTAERLSVFESMFGRASAAALKLSKSGAQLRDLKNIIDSSGGAAARTAKIMDNNLGGASRKLMSAIEGVSIAVGDGLNKKLVGVIKWLTSAATQMKSFIVTNKGLVVVAAEVVAGLLAVGGGLMAVGVAANLTAFSIGGLSITMGVLSKAFVGLLTMDLAGTFAMIGVGAVGVQAAIAPLLVTLGAVAGAAAVGWWAGKRLATAWNATDKLVRQARNNADALDAWAAADRRLVASMKEVPAGYVLLDGKIVKQHVKQAKKTTEDLQKEERIRLVTMKAAIQKQKDALTEFQKFRDDLTKRRSEAGAARSFTAALEKVPVDALKNTTAEYASALNNAAKTVAAAQRALDKSIAKPSTKNTQATERSIAAYKEAERLVGIQSRNKRTAIEAVARARADASRELRSFADALAARQKNKIDKTESKAFSARLKSDPQAALAESTRRLSKAQASATREVAEARAALQRAKKSTSASDAATAKTEQAQAFAAFDIVDKLTGMVDAAKTEIQNRGKALSDSVAGSVDITGTFSAVQAKALAGGVTDRIQKDQLEVQKSIATSNDIIAEELKQLDLKAKLG